jgi:hypothetical protein
LTGSQECVTLHRMGFLIGADEAGYGPNLGPLVVTASVWRVDDPYLTRVDLYDRLAPLVGRKFRHDEGLAIADSKALYRPGGGWTALERATLAGLGVCTGTLPRRWRQLWELLCPDAGDQMDQMPWYAGYDCEVPRDTTVECIEQLVRRLQSQLHQSHVRLLRLSARVLFPARFNVLVDRAGSKGAVLSALTLDLIRDLITDLAAEPVYVVCDKHGGRDRYAGLLQPRFGDRLVRVHQEGRAESRYDVGTPDRPIELCFRAKGEGFLPSALASMAAKYLRELSMAAFNAFWQHHVPNLKPTAGYPVDARRFRDQIAAVQSKLSIDERLLWRTR